MVQIIDIKILMNMQFTVPISRIMSISATQKARTIAKCD